MVNRSDLLIVLGEASPQGDAKLFKCHSKVILRNKNMRSKLEEIKLVKLQEEQRKAEDAGDMVKADRLHEKIERIYNRDN